MLKQAKVRRRGEVVCRCGAAGTHEGVGVSSTRARPADRRLARSQKGSSVIVRNVVKPKTSSRAVDDPISVGVHLLPAPLRDLISGLSPVEMILARKQIERLVKIYGLPTFSSTLKVLTMFALSTGRFLKVRLSSNLISFPQGGTPDIVSAARHVLINWNHQKNTVLLRAARAACRAYNLDNIR